jgi:cell division protein FtsQ
LIGDRGERAFDDVRAPVRPRPGARRGGIARALLSPRIDTGAILSVAVVGLAGVSGFLLGGGYEMMTREYGRPSEIAARLAGFHLDYVTISGQKELAEREVLAAAGLAGQHALPTIDAAEIRTKLLQLPLVADAEVSKLYPNRLVIAIKEREPFALWQVNGKINVVSRDGAVIDEATDDRFIDLPFVAGEGANKRIEEYVRLQKASADLRTPVRAGILVAGRRWTLRMQNGVDVKLPEIKPDDALTRLVQLDREARILQKDALAVDMRIEGRVTVTLTDEGAAARAEAQARKSGKSKASDT